MFQSRVHLSFRESLLSLYSLDVEDVTPNQDAYLRLHLRGKFFDVSELEPLVQLVPVAVDVDLVSEVRRQHPAAAFKTKVLDPNHLDVIYDATDNYFLEF